MVMMSLSPERDNTPGRALGGRIVMEREMDARGADGKKEKTPTRFTWRGSRVGDDLLSRSAVSSAAEA
jgi:hypothetical protein